MAGLSAIAILQREIDERLSGGEPLAQIEDDVIEPSDLSEEDKSALWLYGWASLDDGPHRADHPPVAYARDPEGNLLELPHWS